VLYVAVRAARKAGDLIARAFDERDDIKVHQKSDRDYVTDVDQRAEALILREITQHYPEHGIVAEEMDKRVNPDASIQWYIDPRSEEHTSELQSPMYLVCRLLLEKKKYIIGRSGEDNYKTWSKKIEARQYYYEQ